MRFIQCSNLLLLLLVLPGLQAQEVSSEFTKTYRAYNAAFAQGNYPRAVELAEKAVVLANNELGAEHEKTAIMRINLGHVLVLVGEIERAEPILKHARASFEKIHGEYHSDLVTVYENLAKIYAGKKEIDKSKQALNKVLAIIRHNKGDKDPESADFLLQLGTLELAADKVDAAEKAFQSALSIYQENYGDRSIRAANVISLLGDVELLKKNLAPAQKHYADALGIYEENLLEDDPIVLNAHARMAKMYIALRDQKFAAHADKVIELMRHKEGGAAPMFIMQPQYPVFEDGQKPQGWVLLEFTVTKSGRLQDIKILESLPTKLFDDVTLAVAPEWRFRPKILAGKRTTQTKSRARLVFKQDNIEVHFGHMEKAKS